MKATIHNLIAFLLFTTFNAYCGENSKKTACLKLFSQENQSSLQNIHYHHIIAESPRDNMGRDFSTLFGDFIQNNDAESDNFERLSHEAFQLRLNLAKKYNTNFVSHMETLLDPGKIQFKWKERIEGKLDEDSWSFGIEGHERAHSIWKFLNYNLNEQDFIETKVNMSIFPLVQKTGYQTVKEASFLYKLPNDFILKFQLFKFESGEYFIRHAESKAIPIILDELNRLWEDMLELNQSRNDYLTKLAKFEWLWFWANPYGRAGASIGDSLSMILQKTLIQNNILKRHRESFHHLDLEALCRDLQNYIQYRVQNLKSRDN